MTILNWKRIIPVMLIIYFVYVRVGYAQAGDLGSLEDIAKKGKVKAITSFRSSERLFLAVWYVMPSEQRAPAVDHLLYIFERQENRYSELLRLDAGVEGTWEDIVPFGGVRLPGVAIFSASGISDRGPVTVIALVKGKFQIVYQGDESEFIDLNADGIPEILESVWPDGDGYPKTTTIHIWTGKAYTPLMKSKWSQRFSQAVLNAVRKAFSKNPRR